MTPRVLAVALIAATLVAPCIAATPDFQDVLDTPAMKSPLAAKSLLNDIVLAGKRLVSVGQRGHILYSDDRGKSWSQAGVPVSCDLVAVHFPTPRQGWAVGHEGVVLHSTDGGASWSRQLDGRAAARAMADYYKGHPPAAVPGVVEPSQLLKDIDRFVEAGPDRPFLDVWFENETTGYIVGAFGLIFRTTDGGKSWEPWIDRTENPKLLHFYAIQPVGKDLFICGEQGLVMKLDRELGRFRAVKTPYNGTFFGITGKPGSVIVFGLRGNAFQSQNGGASWRKIETGVQMGLVGGTVTDDGRIVLVSQGGQLLVSADDGATFTTVKVDRPFPATAVVAPGKDALALAGLFGATEIMIK